MVKGLIGRLLNVDVRCAYLNSNIIYIIVLTAMFNLDAIINVNADRGILQKRTTISLTIYLWDCTINMSAPYIGRNTPCTSSGMALKLTIKT